MIYFREVVVADISILGCEIGHGSRLNTLLINIIVNSNARWLSCVSIEKLVYISLRKNFPSDISTRVHSRIEGLWHTISASKPNFPLYWEKIFDIYQRI